MLDQMSPTGTAEAYGPKEAFVMAKGFGVHDDAVTKSTPTDNVQNYGYTV